MSKVDGPSKTMTYEKLLAQATDRLIMAGVTDAQLVAWYLLEDTFGISRADYFLKKRECPEWIPGCWEDRLKLRCDRMPLAYVLGYTEFMGLRFHVEPGVLVPRQDTETLVEWVLKAESEANVAASTRTLSLLDMCTGSGCIGLSLAKLGGYSVTLSDLSPRAIHVSRINRGSLDLEEQVEICHGDLFEALPGMDKESAEVAKALPYRDFMTVGLLVDKLNLKNQTQHKTLGNIVPDCWIYIQERDVKIGRLQIFNNWSPYMVADPENTVWIGLEYFCTEGDDMWTMSDEDFISFAASELVHIGVISEGAVRDSVRVRVKKAYPAYFGAYSQMDKVRDALDTIPNLYCIGRNGQHRYNNMDHSMMTAMVAVDNIKNGISDKSAVWNVNTETEYHEQKQ